MPIFRLKEKGLQCLPLVPILGRRGPGGGVSNGTFSGLEDEIKDQILALPLSCFVCKQVIYPPWAMGSLDDP